ncbi:hypothetical protein [Breoghania sp.]|uniref:hypothetical protein n=1 Tax=Breoghania sp. TaxID=2065378 RepID=UPI00260D0F8D|nr:hypothetical protein [Breoghania sp.]
MNGGLAGEGIGQRIVAGRGEKIIQPQYLARRGSMMRVHGGGGCRFRRARTHAPAMVERGFGGGFVVASHRSN